MKPCRSDRIRRLTTLFAIALGSGALFNTGASCDRRLRTALVDGSKDFLFNVFLPGVAEDFIPGE